MKNAIVNIRMSEMDKKELEKQSKENGMSISEYIRYLTYINKKKSVDK